MSLISMLSLQSVPPLAQAQEPPGPEANFSEIHRELARLNHLVTSEPHRTDLQLDRIRVLYLLALEDRDALDEALRSIATLEPRALHQGPAFLPLLRAYEGALEALKGKHARWPPNKVSHVNDGLATLDAQVKIAGQSAEIRYLRLVTGYYLPFFFRRGDVVQEDLRILRETLPTIGVTPPGVKAVIARFLLEHGDPDQDQRNALMAGWVRACDALTRDHSACVLRPETGAP
ncbi:MAG: hypothetical protein WEA09_00115 [Gemmatimonadota bacterium]